MNNEKVSILIPARGEKIENINRTIDSIHENVSGKISEEYEIILGLDGGHEDISPATWVYKGALVLNFPKVVGIKTNMNAMAAMATGKYIYKSDAHCRVSKGFDEILKDPRNFQENWIVMPRFKIIHDDWSIQFRDGQEEFYDYFYLCCPFTDPKGFRFKAGGHWKEITQEKLNYSDIDETPQIHGSGWFMTKDRYFELGGFPNVDVYGHAQEPIWLAMKNWMAGGRVMVNKKCWYAHLHQQGNKRGYHMDKVQEDRSYKLAADFFVGDKWDDTWPKKVLSFEQFVDKFMPMPSWPENWKEVLHEWQEANK